MIRPNTWLYRKSVVRGEIERYGGLATPRKIIVISMLGTLRDAKFEGIIGL